MSFINILSLTNSFSSVDSVYFDSLKSMHEEQNSNVNSSNIVEMIANNELSYPNNAIYHRQVCFFARNCLCIESSGQRKFPLRGMKLPISFKLMLFLRLLHLIILRPRTYV